MKTFNEILNENKINEQIQIDTIRYERSHNKTPPTKGISSWMFTDVSRGDGEVFEFSGLYKDAITAAKKWAKKNNITTIYPME